MLSENTLNTLMQVVEAYTHYMKLAERHGDKFGDASGATHHWHKIREGIRAIEREAYKAGQERMRERAASKAAEEAGEHGTDSDGWYICKSLSHQIEELEIEEPK